MTATNIPPPESPQDTLVHSYLFLRRAIGLVGLALPVVLIVGKELVQGGGLLNSISGYYYSDMRDVYVGSLCAIGVFLLSYRGYDWLDDVAANVAGVAAIGVALFPTTPAGDPSAADKAIGVAHIVFAAVFFLTLAYFCLVLFRKSDKARPTRRKVQRNQVYLVAGLVILVCLAGIVVAGRFLDDSLHPVLWLESGATLAFGFAWLTKGEAILGDLSPVAVVAEA
ncbi:DUF998 domain-containing protein [Actinokineospora iranica]|uniref:DUF998 domain-containing protein n=1 Tax=Actinokineospora iranica TaxID=1271860 RepID=A0A1G6WHG6_9PSEU|nr:DUF998 domain-containing protein [Actinokineospora iranica]SDD65400.1 hypothetical protein SAMN05216174_11513 [Actinokineospora iranica]